MIDELFAIIEDRKANAPKGSYTAELIAGGPDRILQKVGEEAIEVILASKDEGDVRLIEECADLIYHLLVLLAYHNLTPAQVYAELRRRHSGE